MGITPDESPVCKCCGRWASHLGSLIRTSGGEMHPACWDKHHSHPSGPWPEDHACAVHRGAPVVAERIAREIEYARDKCIREQEELRQYGRGVLYGLALAADIARSHAAPPPTVPEAAGLLAPPVVWHAAPPPGWSTFGAHAFMDKVPALEFWGEEYGGDGLPIWERPAPAPDADVIERITLSTTGDLDALPDGSVVLDGSGRASQKFNSRWHRSGAAEGGRTPERVLRYGAVTLLWSTPPVAATGEAHPNCGASPDGECRKSWCPQNRDGEPYATERSCPLPPHLSADEIEQLPVAATDAGDDRG